MEIGRTREEAGFEYAKDKSQSHDLVVGLGKAEADHADAPEHDNGRQKVSRTELAAYDLLWR